MIYEFALILFLASLWCMGLFALFSPDQIFSKIGTWAENNLPGWAFRPIIGCVTCMSSFHGVIIYAIFLHRDFGLLGLISFVICLAGLNYFLSRFL